MNVLKQNRYLTIVIVLLVLVNLTTIYMLWQSPQVKRQVPIEERRNHIRTLLIKELGFTDSQVEDYFRLGREHHRRTQIVQLELRKVKNQMFDMAFTEKANAAVFDSLLNLSQQKQAELERLTFQHFLNIKAICTPDQSEKLKFMIHDILRPPGGAEHPGPPPTPGQGQTHNPPPRRF